MPNVNNVSSLNKIRLPSAFAYNLCELSITEQLTNLERVLQHLHGVLSTADR